MADDIITAEERAHLKWVISSATNEELAYGGAAFGSLRRLLPRTLAALEAAEAEIERLTKHSEYMIAEVSQANAIASEKRKENRLLRQRAEKAEAENARLRAENEQLRKDADYDGHPNARLRAASPRSDFEPQAWRGEE